MFDELNLWFSKIVPIIEAEWQRGVQNKDNRIFTEFKLAGLAGEVNSIKDFLLLYVNQQIKATKPLAIADFVSAMFIMANERNPSNSESRCCHRTQQSKAPNQLLK